uniref:MADF domain-containing protein n=1 Tax=Anopheles minimus TaxID=112268 RepID=A0A182WHM6_9DIPT
MKSKGKTLKKLELEDHALTSEDTLELISKIERRPLLWNKKDPQYKDVVKQDNAWQALSRELGISVVWIKAKWQNLRSTYRKNRIKVHSSIQTGAVKYFKAIKYAGKKKVGIGWTRKIQNNKIVPAMQQSCCAAGSCCFWLFNGRTAQHVQTPDTTTYQVQTVRLVPESTATEGQTVRLVPVLAASQGRTIQLAPGSAASQTQSVQLATGSSTNPRQPSISANGNTANTAGNDGNTAEQDPGGNASSRVSRHARILSCLEYLQNSYARMQERQPLAAFLDLVGERMLRRKKEDMESLQNDILALIDNYEVADAADSTAEQ